MSHITLLLATLCLVLGTSLPTFAGKECCGKSQPAPIARKGRALDAPMRRGGDPVDRLLHMVKTVQPPLSETQIEQVNKIAEETRSKLNTATTPEERRMILGTMRGRIIHTVLTDEQRASLRVRKPHLPPGPPATPGSGHGQLMLRFFERVRPPLTEDQRQQMTKLADEARAKLQNAQTPEERRAIHLQLRKTIMETVLTEEQRASLREQRAHHRKRTRKREAGQPPAQNEVPPPATE